MKAKAFGILLLGLTAATLCLAGDAKLEQALRNLDDQWSKAAAAKDIDKTVSFYSKDAIAMPPNGPNATTPEAIRALWKDMLTDVALSWNTTKVEVAASGDIGYTSGSYKVTMTDPAGETTKDRGKYLEVWKKQADGSWKCVMDIWNSDIPAATAEKK